MHQKCEVCVWTGRERAALTNEFSLDKESAMASQGKEPTVLFSAHYWPRLSSGWTQRADKTTFPPQPQAWGNTDHPTQRVFSPTPSQSRQWQVRCCLEEDPSFPGTTIIHLMSTQSTLKGESTRGSGPGVQSSKLKGNTRQIWVCKNSSHWKGKLFLTVECQ